jgi:hypothetical protein
LEHHLVTAQIMLGGFASPIPQFSAPTRKTWTEKPHSVAISSALPAQLRCIPLLPILEKIDDAAALFVIGGDQVLTVHLSNRFLQFQSEPPGK